MANGEPLDVAVSRRRMLQSIVVVIPMAAAAWLALFFLTPPIAGADEAINRIGFALGWLGTATLLTLVVGIEAVAHERLFTPAINPLVGAESARLKVNLRYLQNTLEQLAILSPALLLLAWQSGSGEELRAVTATTLVWIALRYVFWIGYHRSHELRTPGLVGMIMTIIVLAIGVARFGFSLAGWPGTIAPLAVFGAIEAYLVWISLKAAT